MNEPLIKSVDGRIGIRQPGFLESSVRTVSFEQINKELPYSISFY